MVVELAQIVAGLPFVVSFAVAGGIASLREGRRRLALNEAVHELRRPLQALALTAPTEPDGGGETAATLRMAVTALERLDRIVNDGAAASALGQVELRSIAEAAVERWQAQAKLGGGAIGLRWHGGPASLEGDGDALARALDNMIINGIEHGGPELTIEGRELGQLLLVVVRDSGARQRPRRRSRFALPRWPRRRSRHGHGLRVIRRAAAAHGGSFCLRSRGSETEAVLELPLRGTPQ